MNKFLPRIRLGPPPPFTCRPFINNRTIQIWIKTTQWRAAYLKAPSTSRVIFEERKKASNFKEIYKRGRNTENNIPVIPSAAFISNSYLHMSILREWPLLSCPVLRQGLPHHFAVSKPMDRLRRGSATLRLFQPRLQGTSSERRRSPLRGGTSQDQS